MKFSNYPTNILIHRVLHLVKLVNLPFSSDTSNYYCPSDITDNNQIELGYNDTCCEQINVRRKSQQEKDSLIELINKLDNPELKRKYTNKLKSLLMNKDKKPHQNKQIISLTTTFE